MIVRAQVWWTILQMCIAERLAYRGDFILGTTMRFLPIVTQIFLWTAVFASAQSDQMAGYSRNDVVAYYLLTMVARAFSSMPGLASGIATQIRDGQIKKFLIQPIDLIGFSLLARIGHKLVYYAIAIGPFAAVFYLCRGFFPGWPAGEVTAAFVASLVLSFLLGFFLESSLGLAGFWTLEISSLLFVYMLFNFFFSGHMFPLDIVPDPWRTAIEYLPLKYLAYFPAAIFLGKVPENRLWLEVGVEAAWVAFFIVLCRWLMHRGFNRYSGFGG
ncbi:MAG: ABC transporter permease [Planctomycetota bacterium]|nr:MAG: ABC transporter permease [Planctomycetota bacterium]